MSERPPPQHTSSQSRILKGGCSSASFDFPRPLGSHGQPDYAFSQCPQNCWFPYAYYTLRRIWLTPREREERRGTPRNPTEPPRNPPSNPCGTPPEPFPQADIAGCCPAVFSTVSIQSAGLPQNNVSKAMIQTQGHVPLGAEHVQSSCDSKHTSVLILICWHWPIPQCWKIKM